MEPPSVAAIGPRRGAETKPLHEPRIRRWMVRPCAGAVPVLDVGRGGGGAVCRPLAPGSPRDGGRPGPRATGGCEPDGPLAPNAWLPRMCSEMGSRGSVLPALGGGVGGVVAASAPRRELASEDPVVLVERSAKHTFWPSLLWLMTFRLAAWRWSGRMCPPTRACTSEAARFGSSRPLASVGGGRPEPLGHKARGGIRGERRDTPPQSWMALPGHGPQHGARTYVAVTVPWLVAMTKAKQFHAVGQHAEHNA